MEQASGCATRRDLRWVVIAILVLAAPTLVVGYLPMTDYPQHLAIVSILRHWSDPAYDFQRWFVIDLGRTLYLLPYGIGWLFAQVTSVDRAMHVVVFLSVIAYPLGLLAVLVATKRPPIFALFAMPFVYNRAFYWGFINFGMGMGLALLALAAFVRAGEDRTRRGPVIAAFTVAIAASVLTHVYGLAFFLGSVALWAVSGGVAEVRKRAPLLVVPLVGAAFWVWLGRHAEAYDPTIVDPPLWDRLDQIGDAICGGFSDGTDNLALAVAVLALLATLGVVLRRSGPEAFGPFERAMAIGCLGNLVLYFILPQATHTAKWIHFRHACLAVCALPLVIPRNALDGTGDGGSGWARGFVRSGLAVLVGLVTLNSWIHLVRFDREAKSFDAVVDAVPPRAKVMSMNFMWDSWSIKAPVYVHFVAYIQARKGGFVAMSFPQAFWNLPVRARTDAGIPTTPATFEWDPRKLTTPEMVAFYDWALVRESSADMSRMNLPFTRTYYAPPWELYVHAAAE